MRNSAIAVVLISAALLRATAATNEYEVGRYMHPNVAGRHAEISQPASLAPYCRMWLTAEFDAYPPSGLNTNYDCSRWTNNTTSAFISSSPEWTSQTWYCDGVDDVHTATASLNNLTNALTLMCWARPINSGGTLLNKWIGASGNRQWMLYWTPSNTVAIYVSVNGNSSVFQSSAVVMSNSWHHCAATFAPGAEMAVYIDGVRSGRLTSGVPSYAWTTTQPTLWANGGGGYFKGWIDDIRIYATAATSNEVNDIWTRTRYPRVSRP